MCDLPCRGRGRCTGASYSLTRSAAVHSTSTHLFFPFPLPVSLPLRSSLKSRAAGHGTRIQPISSRQDLGAATPAVLQETAELESGADAAAESSSPKQTALIADFESVADDSTVAVHGLSSGSLDDQASNVVSVVNNCCFPNESPRVELSVDTSVPVRNAETSAISSPRTPGSSTSSRGTGVFLGGRYSQADIIAFGGIAMETGAGVRSSDRIRAQPNADDTQLERAQRLAQAKDHATSPGYSPHYTLDPYVVLATAGGAATRYGYWVQPFGDGCSGFVQPVQLATCF